MSHLRSSEAEVADARKERRKVAGQGSARSISHTQGVQRATKIEPGGGSFGSSTLRSDAKQRDGGSEEDIYSTPLPPSLFEEDNVILLNIGASRAHHLER